MNDPAAETEAAAGVRPAKKKTPFEQAQKWALEYLKRPRSEKQLRDKLREKGCSEDDIEAVCEKCTDYGFLNDADYAGMVVRYYAGRGYGPGRIRTELNRRGVPKDLWDEALEELPEGTDTIDRLLATRLRGRDASDRKERDKAANALFRKGYSWDEIRGALSRYGADEEMD